MSAEASSLKAGVTKSGAGGIKSQANVSKKGGTSKIAGGQTKVGGSLANQKKTNKSRMKTSTSERDNEIVKMNDLVVTPKKLISDKFKELAQVYLSAQQEAIEKKKNQKTSMTGKGGSASIVDSSVRSHQQSADKSSSSDVKVSSSNVQEKSSFMESKRSDDTYSDSDSRRDQSEAQDKKPKKHKGLTDDDLDELVTVHLGETSTLTLLFIPSAQIQQEFGQQQGILARNAAYERLLIDKIGSDNYTDRSAQTFNFQPKQKDQQSIRVEKNDAGAFAAVWDLYDVRMQDQLNEFEMLQEDIKKNIDKELHERQKNPFFMLSTDVKAISIHSRKEAPGTQQSMAEKLQGANKPRTGPVQNKPGHSSLSGGQTNFQQSGQQQEQKDDTIKNSSTSQTNTKIGAQPTVMANNQTRSHGRTNQQLQQQQLILQQQQLQQQLEEEEEVYLKEVVEGATAVPTDLEQKVLHSENLATSLSFVERILNQNHYHKQYIQYRNYPEVKFEKMTLDDDVKRGPGGFRRAQNVQKQEEQDDAHEKKADNPLNYLFKYSCALTQDRTVSSADWNPINQDLLAVSYGENDLNASQTKREGYIMFWTLKNPTYPERIIRYPSRITCCKFSDNNPNLIAAGTYDGVVAIYDIRRKEDTPVTQNKEMTGKHNDAVWEVQWVGKGNKGGDKGEALVSISSDSRIVEWSMKKGLEYTDLMNLKRQSHPSQKDTNQEGVNFRWAAGFSFDFLKGESSMYLAATEEGTVHRCSKSYAEQYLDSYFGHSGPVYKIRCNPFFSDVFLTCSADWSCKLWNWREEVAIANFQSLDLYDEVLDAEWSPHCSTLFASVCKDGRLEMWDLCKNNMLDPFATVRAPEGQIWPAKTMVRFGRSSPVVITGDTAGDVRVYRLNGYEDCEPKQQSDRLVKLLYPTGYTKGGKEKFDS